MNARFGAERWQRLPAVPPARTEPASPERAARPARSAGTRVWAGARIVYDVTDNVLYEAKGLPTRKHVRMAIGQLLDYRRHIRVRPGLRLAVLLPREPSADIRDLLAAENIALVTQTDSGFAGFPPPLPKRPG